MHISMSMPSAQDMFVQHIMRGRRPGMRTPLVCTWTYNLTKLEEKFRVDPSGTLRLLLLAAPDLDQKHRRL